MSQPTVPMQLCRLLEAEPSRSMPRRNTGTSAIAGERETKLKRYAALHMPEVGFWIDNEIRTYRLDEETDEYRQTPRSRRLPELDLQRLAIASTQAFVE